MVEKKEISDAEKIRLAKNEYMRGWRQKNLNKVRQYQNKKWLRYYDEKIKKQSEKITS